MEQVASPIDNALVSTSTLDKITDAITKKNPNRLLKAFSDKHERGLLKTMVKEMFPKMSEERVEYAMAEIVGMGFVERIVAKYTDTTDIRFNGAHVTVKTNKRKFIYTDEVVTEDDVYRIIMRFANSQGKEFTEKRTRLNLQYGYMRVNAVHKKNAIYGTTMAIRISRPKLVVTEDNFHTLADDFILDLIRLCVEAGSNIILSGIPGSGKTELTKTMLGYLSFKDVIITIEDTPEGHFKQLYPDLDITSWYTSNNLTESELISESLRNDCDWLLVTETREAQAAYALFTGFLTGLHGLTSIHAKSASEIPNRYYNMIKAGITMDKEAFYDDFYKTATLGFHQDRRWINGENKRYIDEIVEFDGESGKPVVIYRRWEEDGHFYSEVPNPISNELKNHIISRASDISVLEGTGLLERVTEE